MTAIQHRPGCSTPGETLTEGASFETGDLTRISTCGGCGRRHIERIDWRLTEAARKASARQDQLAAENALEAMTLDRRPER